MTNEEIKTKVADLLERHKSLSATDKADIKAMCKDAEINVTFAKRCNGCYLDALLLLKQHCDKNESKNIATPSGNYIYHNGTSGTTWRKGNRITILSAMSSDAEIERFIESMPQQRVFTKTTAEAEKGDENND